MLGWLVIPAWAGGTVTVPLDLWNATAPAASAPVADAALPIDRSVSGRLERGQLEGTVRARFEARGASTVPVPVLASSSTPVSALLDGRIVTLRPIGEVWGIDAPAGVHTVEVRFLHGIQTERFARELELPLPPGGPTAIDLVLPEAPIAPDLRSGVLERVQPVAGGTRIEGWLADGGLSLRWERRSDGPVDPTTARIEASLDAVLTLGEDVVTGIAQVSLAVREGEIDRFEVALPPEAEVLDVGGSSVLQWHTDSDEHLIVLLRHVADGETGARVRYQYPVRRGAEVPLRVPLPIGDDRVRGTVGVSAPVGLEVTLGPLAKGKLLEPRDVPPSVLSLTDAPLRSVLSFEGEAPEAAVTLERQADLHVSPTRIDDLQGITVLMEDGSEVGKLRLAVRNTARQVLTVDLPPGAALTHCFRDGVPLRPAATEAPDRVLIPLTRSDQTERGAREHVVAFGDMLSGLAQRYYGDASRWTVIEEANRETLAGGLQPGQRLVLPAIDRTDREAAFVLELGWERRRSGFGPLGLRTVALPGLDLEVMAANWHLYLPDVLEPVWIDGIGVIPIDGRRTDPVRRVLDLLVMDLVPGTVAHAGMPTEYKSALEQRRTVYIAEQAAAATPEGDPFPLVGRRIRLRGVLLGTDPAAVRVAWVTHPVAGLARWLVLGLAAAVAFAAARWPRRWEVRAAVAIGLAGVAFVGHHLLGIHRSAVWGADLGLWAAIATSWRGGARLGWEPPGCLPAGIGFVAILWTLVRPELLPLTLAMFSIVATRRLR